MTTNADITIFNARYQEKSRTEAFVPTTIKGVSLLISDAVSTNDGVWTDQAVYKIRVPYSGAEIQGSRKYMPEDSYRDSDGSGAWTIRKGDYVALGLYASLDDAILTKSELDTWASKNHIRLFQITEYSDNTVRGCDAVKHWRIGGA